MEPGDTEQQNDPQSDCCLERQQGAQEVHEWCHIERSVKASSVKRVEGFLSCLLCFSERNDGSDGVFIRRAALEAHPSPPTQLPFWTQPANTYVVMTREVCVCARVRVSSLSLHYGQVLARLLSSVPASQWGKQLAVASGEAHH